MSAIAATGSLPLASSEASSAAADQRDLSDLSSLSGPGVPSLPASLGPASRRLDDQRSTATGMLPPPSVPRPVSASMPAPRPGAHRSLPPKSETPLAAPATLPPVTDDRAGNMMRACNSGCQDGRGQGNTPAAVATLLMHRRHTPQNRNPPRGTGGTAFLGHPSLSPNRREDRPPRREAAGAALTSAPVTTTAAGAIMGPSPSLSWSPSLAWDESPLEMGRASSAAPSTVSAASMASVTAASLGWMTWSTMRTNLAAGGTRSRSPSGSVRAGCGSPGAVVVSDGDVDDFDFDFGLALDVDPDRPDESVLHDTEGHSSAAASVPVHGPYDESSARSATSGDWSIVASSPRVPCQSTTRLQPHATTVSAAASAALSPADSFEPMVDAELPTEKGGSATESPHLVRRTRSATVPDRLVDILDRTSGAKAAMASAARTPAGTRASMKATSAAPQIPIAAPMASPAAEAPTSSLTAAGPHPLTRRASLSLSLSTPRTSFTSLSPRTTMGPALPSFCSPAFRSKAVSMATSPGGLALAASSPTTTGTASSSLTMAPPRGPPVASPLELPAGAKTPGAMASPTSYFSRLPADLALHLTGSDASAASATAASPVSVGAPAPIAEIVSQSSPASAGGAKAAASSSHFHPWGSTRGLFGALPVVRPLAPAVHDGGDSSSDPTAGLDVNLATWPVAMRGAANTASWVDNGYVHGGNPPNRVRHDTSAMPTHAGGSGGSLVEPAMAPSAEVAYHGARQSSHVRAASLGSTTASAPSGDAGRPGVPMSPVSPSVGSRLRDGAAAASVFLTGRRRSVAVVPLHTEPDRLAGAAVGGETITRMPLSGPAAVVSPSPTSLASPLVSPKTKPGSGAPRPPRPMTPMSVAVVRGQFML